MLTIWGRDNSVNVQKVVWAAAELRLDFERVDAGGAFGGLDTAEYGVMNPNRKIPVLRDGDAVVWESNACVRYLAARYGRGTLWPEDPVLRARADQWMDWQISTLLPDMSVVFWQLIRTPEAERDMTSVAASAERLQEIWPVLDSHLKTRPFVGGSGFTMGDIPLGAMAWRWYNLPLRRGTFDNVEAWYHRLQERPAYREHVMVPVT